ncbi:MULTISPECIES: TetR/AcrR family transcriptional regulator [Amycolatopsis]|uniref:TetR/AcrR family transcriptional regulator n=1 Tax=Amycolatopsis tucumanensis TaxID=401106 RepID=A0ABP7J165_9PSEU|nr:MULTISPECIES: TetR/AcrR family transcriptional regulator [Amycolatopsis]MCF6422272.1 TetR/AcrR family transcriptional regulator [Amycolatopsis tucumanensis]
MATRHGHGDSHSRERFLQAALTVLLKQGVAGLTVRSVAEAAGTSTIGVYTRFGGRNGVLDALYERTFEMLHEEFRAVPPVSGDPAAGILALARAYRRFALDSPARYAFMFEQSVPGFDPDPDLRAFAQRSSFDLLVDRVAPVTPPGRDPNVTGYLIWTTMHGLVSVELTHRARNPPPKWFIETTDDAYDEVFGSGIRAMINGLDLELA